MADIYRQLISDLEHARRVLITTHVRPDGDALGSLGAMAVALRQRRIAADTLVLSHWPSKYEFLREQLALQPFDAESSWPAALDLSAYDVLLVVDTGTWSQLPGLQKRLDGFAGRKLILDHHLTQEDWADHKLVIQDAGAAGEIVAELLEQWQITLSPDIATALFVAITTDTGWFQFSNTRPFTLRLAARLLEAGVDMDGIYKRLYQSEREARVRLQTRAMQSMEILGDGRLAVMTLRKDDFELAGAGMADTENLINVPLQIGSIEASILITEPIDFGPVRVSVRSKGVIDVSKFAQQFGGGGHYRAAGMKVDGSVDQVRDRVVTSMVAELAG